MATLISPAGWGAEWSTRAWTNMQAEYNDNVLLVAHGAEASEDAKLNAGVQLRNADSRGYLQVTPSLQISRYTRTKALDNTIQVVDGSWARNWERGEMSVAAGWTRDTTLTSELAVSGLVQSQKRRIQRYVAPKYSYTLTPRSSLALNASYTKVKYADALFTGLVDYNNASMSMTASYEWSERTTVSGTIYGTRYEAERIGTRLHTSGAQLDVGTSLSDRWDGAFGVGFYRSSKNGGLLNVDLSRKDELGKWRFGVSRTVEPSGSGVLVQQDLLTISREHSLGPLWHLSAAASWIVNKDFQSSAAVGDRHYRSLALSLSRTLTPSWRMEARYAYDHQKYYGGVDQAERNAIMLGIHYSRNE